MLIFSFTECILWRFDTLAIPKKRGGGEVAARFAVKTAI